MKEPPPYLQEQDFDVNKIFTLSLSPPPLRTNEENFHIKLIGKRTHIATKIPCYVQDLNPSKSPHLLTPISTRVRLVIFQRVTMYQLSQVPKLFKKSCDFYWALVTIKLYIHIVVRVELCIHTLMIVWFYRIHSFLIFHIKLIEKTHCHENPLLCSRPHGHTPSKSPHLLAPFSIFLVDLHVRLVCIYRHKFPNSFKKKL